MQVDLVIEVPVVSLDEEAAHLEEIGHHAQEVGFIVVIDVATVPKPQIVTQLMNERASLLTSCPRICRPATQRYDEISRRNAAR